MKTGFPSRDSEEEPQNIIEIRPYKKTEEQDHTGHLGILHKLVARFAAGYHLVEEEPPSNAGIGSIFMKARIMDRKAVMYQN